MAKRTAATKNVNRVRRSGRPAALRRAVTTVAVLALLLATAFSTSDLAAVQIGGTQQSPGGARFNRDDPLAVDADNLDIERPSDWPVYELYDVYENLFQDRGDPQQKRAVNINTLGEVPDSSWFNNRLGAREMSLEEVATGPDLTGPPADGQWAVIGRPGGGVTPKFMIEDREGDRFIIKFDPIDYPEIASGAEMISSKFFHAFGYNVAEAYIVTLTKDRIEIAPGATFTSDLGVRREIDQIDIDEWMSNAPAGPDGAYRALASKFVPGEGVGEFRFFGTRPDDPNDIFPHEHRRELRGYRVISAWLNHDDSRALNTYDAFVEENGRSFVKHYMLDFGSALGSASIGANEPRGGNEYFIEGGPAWKAALTLGIWHRPWLRADMPDLDAIGNFEAEYFVPAAWKPEYPNAAFDHMDAADAFWAARILAEISDAIIEDAVADARFSDPRAGAYVNEVLRVRRDRAVDHWITQTSPLDNFDLSGSGGSLTLDWDNAAIRVGAAAGGDSYGVRWSSFDNRSGGEAIISDTEVDDTQVGVPGGAWGTPDGFGYRYARAHIFTRHPDFAYWERPVIVTLRDKGSGDIDIVGIDRPLEYPDES